MTSNQNNKNFSLEGDPKCLRHFGSGKISLKIRWKFKLDIGMSPYRVSQKRKKKNPAIVMKGDIKDRHNILIYFKSNLYARLF